MTPRRFALVGDPVSHSKSPAMHRAAFEALALPHTYEAVLVTAADLPAYVARVRSGDLGGFNVTIPYKRAVLEHVDVVDPSAMLAGAANTIYRDAGRVHATNTDVAALAGELRALGPDACASLSEKPVSGPPRKAVVLGAGGAARSAVVALGSDLSAHVVEVRARRGAPELAREMQSKLRDAGSKCEVSGRGLEPHADETIACVVQATSAGMTGADDGEAISSAIDWDHVPPRAIALDVVYAPADTSFLAAARVHGLRHANGLGMLARQGALALEVWLGRPAPYNAMLGALL